MAGTVPSDFQFSKTPSAVPIHFKSFLCRSMRIPPDWKFGHPGEIFIFFSCII